MIKYMVALIFPAIALFISRFALYELGYTEKYIDLLLKILLFLLLAYPINLAISLLTYFSKNKYIYFVLSSANLIIAIKYPISVFQWEFELIAKMLILILTIFISLQAYKVNKWRYLKPF